MFKLEIVVENQVIVGVNLYVIIGVFGKVGEQFDIFWYIGGFKMILLLFVVDGENIMKYLQYLEIVIFILFQI